MVHVRKLDAADAELFRSLRLEALQASPGSFSSTLERERAAPPSRWISLIAGPDGAIFGLFEGAAMIGLTAVYTDRDDPTGTTAGFAMSYIRPEFRGRGLSQLLYEARLGWVKARPRFKRVLVGHRASNEASRRANQRHGFQLIDRSLRTWPDGLDEDELIYELSIG